MKNKARLFFFFFFVFIITAFYQPKKYFFMDKTLNLFKFFLFSIIDLRKISFRFFTRLIWKNSKSKKKEKKIEKSKIILECKFLVAVFPFLGSMFSFSSTDFYDLNVTLHLCDRIKIFPIFKLR